MAEYQFEPVYVESHEPFSLTYENSSGTPVNWLVGSSFDGTQDTPASSLPGSGDDIVLNGYDFIGGGGPYGTAADGVMDSGDLTVIGDASSIAVSMAGQSFKLANGSGGQTTFTPTVGAANLTAGEADLCAVGAAGEIIAPTVDTVFVAGGTVSATTITNLTEGVTGVVPGVDMYKQSFQGAIKGFTDGGTVVATNIIGENTASLDLIYVVGAGDGIKGTISAGNIYALSNGMAVEVVGTNQSLTVVNYENFLDSPGGLTDDLTVVSGGTVNITGSDEFGQMAGDADTVTISGKGALLSLGATPFELGVSGSVGFDVDSGGTAISQQGLNAGLASSGNATIVVSGSGALLSAADFEIGGSGSATMMVQGGGKVVASSYVDIGINATGSGALFVTGSATTFSATTSTIEVGAFGAGSFNVGSGQKFTGQTIDVGEFSGARGTVNLNSAQITVSSMDVGGGPNAAGGEGTVNVNAGGKLLVSGNLNVWDQGTVTLSASSPSLALAVVSGDLMNSGTISAGQGGTLGISGAVSGAGVIEIGRASLVALGGAVSAGQNFEFEGTKAELLLAAPASFNGVISGFAPTDIIDLASMPFNTGSKVKVVGSTVIVTPTNGSPVQLNFGSNSAQRFRPEERRRQRHHRRGDRAAHGHQRFDQSVERRCRASGRYHQYRRRPERRGHGHRHAGPEAQRWGHRILHSWRLIEPVERNARIRLHSKRRAKINRPHHRRCCCRQRRLNRGLRQPIGDPVVHRSGRKSRPNRQRHPAGRIRYHGGADLRRSNYQRRQRRDHRQIQRGRKCIRHTIPRTQRRRQRRLRQRHRNYGADVCVFRRQRNDGRP